MAPELTPWKDEFPSTSEQANQLELSVHGAAAQTSGLNPAGNESMPRVAQGDLVDEVEALQQETTTGEEVQEQLGRIQSNSPYNAAGQEQVKKTSDSLQGGEY